VDQKTIDQVKDNKEKIQLAILLLEDIISHDRGFFLPETPAAQTRKKTNSLQVTIDYLQEMIDNHYYLDF
jgi:hypothetical protein